MNSVIQSEKECFICKTRYGLQAHHLLHGTANRKLADKYGYWVYLCADHHTGDHGVHRDKKTDVQLKQLAQKHFEAHHGTRTDFINTFGKSWL